MALYLPKFCIVPLEARLDRTLSDSAKIYLGEVNVLTNKFGYCCASDEDLAEMKDVSVRTIQNWHKELEVRGFVKRHTWKEHIKGKSGSIEVRTKRNLYVLDSSKKDADTQDSARHSDTQDSACHSDTQDSACINKQSQDVNNNNRAAPSPPASPPLAESVVVFSCLRDLPINQTLKSRLSKDFTEGQLQQAVQEYEDSEVDITNVYGWIVGSINNGGYVKSASSEEKVKENKLWAQGALKRFDDIPSASVGLYRCEVLNKYVDFSSGCKSVSFDYEDTNFKTAIFKFLQDNGV